MRGSYAPTRPEDQSRRRRCATCGAEFFAKRTGRKRKYCSNSCRDTHRRQLNFQFFGSARYPCQAKPQNAKNSATVSKNCDAGSAGRGSVDKALWHRVIDVEIIEQNRWQEVVSRDGVVCQVAQLGRSPLVTRHDR